MQTFAQPFRYWGCKLCHQFLPISALCSEKPSIQDPLQFTTWSEVCLSLAHFTLKNCSESGGTINAYTQKHIKWKGSWWITGQLQLQLPFHATQVYSTVIYEDRKNELAHIKKKKTKKKTHMWLWNPIKNNSFHKSLKKLGGSELTLTRQRWGCFYCFLRQFKSCSNVINLSFQAGGLQEWCIFLA